MHVREREPDRGRREKGSPRKKALKKEGEKVCTRKSEHEKG